MSPDEFATKWASEARAMEQRGALVNGAALLHEVLHDYDAVVTGFEDETLTLANASRESGYSADHLGLLIRQGKIPNAGRPNAPRLRRRDLPRKAARLPSTPPAFRFIGATPRQIARAVVTSDQEVVR